jgi:hypothetical protein
MFGSPWRFELSRGTSALTSNRDAWDALATLYPSPYLTHAWLASWAEAYQYELVCATLRTADGILVAGALLRTVPGGYASGCDVDWDVVAIDEAARRQLWEELANLSPWRFYLGQLRVGSSEMQLARDVLGRAGKVSFRLTTEGPAAGEGLGELPACGGFGLERPRRNSHCEPTDQARDLPEIRTRGRGTALATAPLARTGRGSHRGHAGHRHRRRGLLHEDRI